jgi:hypothetical protein
MCCFMLFCKRLSIMSNSLQQHSNHEARKQLNLRMKNRGLESIKVEVTRRAGKMKFNFTGSPAEVIKAEAILADWA